MSTTPVHVNGLCCRYGNFEAVSGVGFTVREGETYALLGTNGAGKTTILETVQGFRRPDAGSVKIFGLDPSRRFGIRPRVGTMLQESGFVGDLTVRETLRLFGVLSGRRDDDDRLLHLTDLAHRAEVRVAQLSGGERRRLDFAAAIYGTPELIFLDEPTTGLDPEARGRVWEIVKELQASGVAILLTTHYLEEAERNADRIGLVHQGSLVREGTLEELVARFPARISFRLHPMRDDLPIVGAARDGDMITVITGTLQRDLLRLLRWANDTNIELTELRAAPSDLNRVFAALTQEAVR